MFKKKLFRAVLAASVFASVFSFSPAQAKSYELTGEPASMTVESHGENMAQKALTETDNRGNIVAEVTYTEFIYPELNDILKKRIEEINYINERVAKDKLAALMKRFEEDFESGRKDLPLPYFSRTESRVLKADDSGLSILYALSANMGGAHPGFNYAAMNFDAQGNYLTAESIAVELGALCSTLKSEIEKTPYAAQCFDLEKSFNEYYAHKGKDFVFVRNEEAVYFYFSPYAVAPWAAGPTMVKLSYDEFPDVVRKL